MTEPDPGVTDQRGWCRRCGQPVQTARQMLDHVRREHRDDFEDIEAWPDGTVPVWDVDERADDAGRAA